MLRDELHDTARQTDDFRQGGEIPQGVLIGDWARCPIDVTDGELRESTGVVANHGNRPRECTVTDCPIQNGPQ